MTNVNDMYAADGIKISSITDPADALSYIIHNKTIVEKLIQETFKAKRDFRSSGIRKTTAWFNSVDSEINYRKSVIRQLEALRVKLYKEIKEKKQGISNLSPEEREEKKEKKFLLRNYFLEQENKFFYQELKKLGWVDPRTVSEPVETRGV